MTKPRIAVAVETVLETARDRLKRTGRTRLSDFLVPDYADHLLRSAAQVTYATVAATETRHLDMPSTWLATLEPEQKIKLASAFQARATHHFGYLYDNYPIYDLDQEGRLEQVWSDLVSFLNGGPFLELMRQVTGESRIALADAQLTRFRPGHFLTRHEDEAEGKNRYFAYVLSLSPNWNADWGGLLAFPNADEDVAEAFTPRFNTLNILRVPQPHFVTQVALFAGADRISVTGWLRGV